MKRLLILGLILMLTILTAGCSGSSEPAKTPAPAEEPADQPGDQPEDPSSQQNTDSPMIETIQSTEVSISDNLLVAVRDYDGKYLDQLKKIEIDVGGGNNTYSVGIFGDAEKISYIYGEYQTDGGRFKEVGENISDSLITFKNVPGGGELYFGVDIVVNNMGYRVPLTINDEYTEAQGLLIIGQDGQQVEVGTNPTTNADQDQTSDTTPILLDKYEFNKEYQYDLDGNQEVDTFKVESDGKSYVDLFINHFAYNSVYDDLSGELTFSQYKVVKMNDCNKYAFVFFEASPPNEQEIYFYEYEESEYDRKDQRKHTELTKIGVVTAEFTDLFNSEITYLSQDQVTFGNQTFSFEEGDDTSYGAIPSTSDYLKIVEIPSNGVSKASLTETYHGELIEHSRYAAVVVEDYPYDGNYPFQYGMQYTNPAYIGSEYSTTYVFAVMGEIYNVRIVSVEYMDAPRKEHKIADKIEDALVEVVSSFPTDFSGDTIVFDCNGETHQFHVEDMSDNKDVIAIKLPY